MVLKVTDKDLYRLWNDLRMGYELTQIGEADMYLIASPETGSRPGKEIWTGMELRVLPWLVQTEDSFVLTPQAQMARFWSDVNKPKTKAAVAK